MIHFLKAEFIGIWKFLKRNSRETLVISFATLVLTLNRYRPIFNEWLGTFIYYFVIPVLVVLIVLRKNPLDVGLGIGNPRIWGKDVLIICIISAAVLYGASFIPALQNYYRMPDFNFLSYFLTSCVALFASEFLYRGFLIFGLKEKFGEGSILIQMIPFALLHLGKAEVETVSTIFTGILFGYVAYRGNSFLPAFIIHLFINIFFVTLINLRVA